MLWHRQTIFESKGDKLSTSAECRIRSQGLWNRISSRLNARWQTDWATENQTKKLELNGPSLWSASIQPTRPHCHTYIQSYIHTHTHIHTWQTQRSPYSIIYLLEIMKQYTQLNRSLSKIDTYDWFASFMSVILQATEKTQGRIAVGLCSHTISPFLFLYP